MDTVAIFGVGLIGGSFGLALRKAGFTGTILGVSSPRSIDQALNAAQSIAAYRSKKRRVGRPAVSLAADLRDYRNHRETQFSGAARKRW